MKSRIFFGKVLFSEVIHPEEPFTLQDLIEEEAIVEMMIAIEVLMLNFNKIHLIFMKHLKHFNENLVSSGMINKLLEVKIKAAYIFTILLRQIRKES